MKWNEVERRRKRALVPKEVDLAYTKEYIALYKEIFGGEPNENKGIMYYINHQEEWIEREKKFKELYPIYKKRQEELHKKHYGPYGL